MNLRDVRAAMLPRSLRSQFIWAAVVLAVLIATCGITAVYALRASTSATRLLANDQLVLMDVAHELVQQTLLIERESSQLETAGSVETTRASYADILKQLEAFDHLSGRLAAANNDVSVLDLHQSSQLFRNTVNIVAQLRESQLGSDDARIPAASHHGPGVAGSEAGAKKIDDRFSEALRRQAAVMVESAELQSDRYTRDFQEAVQRLADTSADNQRWITAMIASCLAFAWLVAHAFLGKHVLSRLELVSSNLRFDDVGREHVPVPVQGRDEIGEMARAVEQFQRDRRQLALANFALQEERARQEELIHELAHAHGQLLQSEKLASIGQLAAGVAHEINNPVGFVNANLGTFKRYVADLFAALSAYEKVESEMTPASRAAIHELKRELDLDYLRTDIATLLTESVDGMQRVKRIVQGLRDFSQQEATERRWACLESTLDTTLDIVWNELKHKAEVKKEYGAIPQVECIPSQLGQVFMNLLVNAAQAIEGHGCITVRTGHDEQHVWVEVEDTGSGIKPEHRGRIFDPFFTTKPVGGGTGLGLSISYGVVKKQGGRIDVQTEIGKGSSFRVVLPRHVQEALV